MREALIGLLATCLMVLVLWLPAQILGFVVPLEAGDTAMWPLWRRALLAASAWAVRLSPFLLALAMVERGIHWLLYVRRSLAASNGDAWQARQAATTSAVACAGVALLGFAGSSLARGFQFEGVAVAFGAASAVFIILAPCVFLAGRLVALVSRPTDTRTQVAQPSSRTRSSRLHRLASTAITLGVVFAIGLTLQQWSLAKETETDLARKVTRARDEVRKLEVTANKLEEFKTEVQLRSARLEDMRKLVPADLDRRGVEEEVRDAGKRSGLEILDVALSETRTQVVTEAAFTLKVAGSRAAAERFAARLSERPHLYRLDDIFLPGPQGRIRLRAFAGVSAAPPRTVRETSCSIPPAPPLAFLTRVSDLRAQLASTCARLEVLSVVATQVAGLQGITRTVTDLANLVERIRGLPSAAVETEFTPSRLTVSELRVEALEADGPAPQATVSLPEGKNLRLRAGDRLADAIVSRVSELGLFVQPELPRWDGAKSGKQSPLR